METLTARLEEAKISGLRISSERLAGFKREVASYRLTALAETLRSFSENVDVLPPRAQESLLKSARPFLSRTGLMPSRSMAELIKSLKGICPVLFSDRKKVQDTL